MSIILRDTPLVGEVIQRDKYPTAEELSHINSAYGKAMLEVLNRKKLVKEE